MLDLFVRIYFSSLSYITYCYYNSNIYILDLSVPTDPGRTDEENDTEASKKERVRRKWSQFKKVLNSNKEYTFLKD